MVLQNLSKSHLYPCNQYRLVQDVKVDLPLVSLAIWISNLLPQSLECFQGAKPTGTFYKIYQSFPVMWVRVVAIEVPDCSCNERRAHLKLKNQLVAAYDGDLELASKLMLSQR